MQQLLQSLDRQILRLHGDDDSVSSGQCVDGQHTEGRLAVDEDMAVLVPDRVQILPQNGLAAHSIDQSDLHGRQFDIGKHEINPFRMMENAFAAAHGLICQNQFHGVGNRKRQLIRFGISQADG